MQAGTLDERVTIQALTTVQNAYGEPVETWTDSATVWADVRPASGWERFVSGADQEQAVVSHVVTMRYQGGVSPVTHRFSWGGRVLDVEAVRDVTGRMAELQVLCREVIGAGEITAFIVSQGRLPLTVPWLRWGSVSA